MLTELWHNRSFPHAPVKHAPSWEDTSSYSLFGTHVVGSNPAVLTVKNLPHRLSYGSLLQAGNTETGRGDRQVFTICCCITDKGCSLTPFAVPKQKIKFVCSWGKCVQQPTSEKFKACLCALLSSEFRG